MKSLKRRYIVAAQSMSKEITAFILQQQSFNLNFEIKV